jgi:anti-sigma regulatory factor (Ser/Thr protein kinase)
VLDGAEEHLALPAAPTAAGIARAFVRDQLVPTATDATVDAVTLCVSELVTNALDHATPPIELRMARDDGYLRIEVSDTSTAQPVARSPEPGALRGRGLQFVDQSALSWGVDPSPHGKTVWAEFGLH